MYPWDWEQLGIAPTRDVTAIKRAYALRLRVTRPDDDAQAYQELRQAYDRAQHWARYAPEAAEDDDANGETLVARGDGLEAAAEASNDTLRAAPATATDAAATDAASAEPLLPAFESPESLCEDAYRLWKRQGADALLDDWPRIEAALSQLPLACQAEASARFADLVIRAPQMPSRFLCLLQDHFGWLGDFRTDRVIGSARAEALRELLGDLVIRPITDPQTLEDNARLLQLNRLRRDKGRIAGWLFAALMGAPLERRLRQASDRLLAGLGIGVSEQWALGNAITAALWLRVAALWSLMLLAVVLVSASTQQALNATVFVGVLSFLGYFLMLAVGTYVSHAVNGGTAWIEPIARPLARLRRIESVPWWGIAAMALGALVMGFALRDPAPGWWWLGAALLIASGLVACWPAHPDRGVVAVGIWLFLTACIVRCAPLDGLVGVAFAGAGACTMLGVVLVERDLHPPLAGIAQRVLFGVTAWTTIGLLLGDRSPSLPLMLLLPLILMMPLVPLVVASRRGHRFALAPMALAAAAVHAGGEAGGGQWLLVGWGVAIVALMLVQRAADAATEALFESDAALG